MFGIVSIQHTEIKAMQMAELLLLQGTACKQ